MEQVYQNEEENIRKAAQTRSEKIPSWRKRKISYTEKEDVGLIDIDRKKREINIKHKRNFEYLREVREKLAPELYNGPEKSDRKKGKIREKNNPQKDDSKNSKTVRLGVQAESGAGNIQE